MQELPDVLQEIDEDISTPRSVLNYPYIYLSEAKEVLGLIIPLLQPGELQLILTMNGSTREVGTVEKSVLELHKLVRVCRFDYVVSPELRYKITSALDLLELPEHIWTQ